MHLATSSFLFLVVMPGATSSDALVTSSCAFATSSEHIAISTLLLVAMPFSSSFLFLVVRHRN